jgi:glycolate oxidase
LPRRSTSGFFPRHEAAAHLLLEVDGMEEDRVLREAEILGEACLAGRALDVLVADAPGRQSELWRLRRSVGEAVKKISVYKEEDTVVPRDAIGPLVSGVKAIGRRHGIRTICYGHAADGNIHVNVLKAGMDDARWNEALPGAIEEIFRLAVGLGGMISGEHGIGLTQKPWLPIALSETELAITRRIKRAFDPEGLLNPGKILD